jgi:hypothetical protein
LRLTLFSAPLRETRIVVSSSRKGAKMIRKTQRKEGENGDLISGIAAALFAHSRSGGATGAITNVLFFYYSGRVQVLHLVRRRSSSH